MMVHFKVHRAQQQAGFSLIEVLVGCFLLGCILLNVEGLQRLAVRSSLTAYYFSRALNQIQSGAERLSSSHQQAMPQLLKDWNEENKGVLPLGWGNIKGVYPNYQITVWWGSEQHEPCQIKRIGLIGCLPWTLNLSDYFLPL